MTKSQVLQLLVKEGALRAARSEEIWGIQRAKNLVKDPETGLWYVQQTIH
jgi:hypothetical protein